jgi:hypothetical protein
MQCALGSSADKQFTAALMVSSVVRHGLDFALDHSFQAQKDLMPRRVFD